ncbi:MAG: FkbM family methyltransferase [Gracilibacteraceae bacterium]|jgi:FkbM family methyltransferase|nr:FkbM family methyltransferase [Gracilibacteraceae bacterium]
MNYADEIISALNEQDMETALALIEKNERKHGEEAAFLCAKAIFFLHLRDYRAAEKILAYAVDRHPNDDDSWYNLAYIWQKMGVADKAERAYQAAYMGTANKIEREFSALAEFVANAEEAELTARMRDSFEKWRREVPAEAVGAVRQFWSNLRFWGDFRPEEGCLEMLEQRAACLKLHGQELRWFFDALGDYRSKAVLKALLQYWLDLRPEPMQQVREYAYPPYFDLDLITCGPDEVFVDLGAYVGDTVSSFLNIFGSENYRRIYCYDIFPQFIESIKQNFASCRDIVLRAKGVGATQGTMYLPGNSGPTALREDGTHTAPVVALDEDITEPITFLKMDIEGAEYDALLGASRHIREDRPKLAICLYHTNDDLWRIPALIHSICPDYRFYLRYYGGGPEMNGVKLIIADYVLYCVPEKNNR